MVPKKVYVIDVEGDGLYPSKLHCLAYWSKETGLKVLNDYEEMKKFLLSADALVVHNGMRWDFVHLQRLLKIKITAKIVDTLALSWTMFPDRNRHGLEEWGEDFGVPKPKISSWTDLSVEEYNHRCSEDVKITTRLWHLIYNKLTYLYNNQNKLWEYIDYISFKMNCARLQEESGWKVDVKYCTQELEKLIIEQSKKQIALTNSLPRVPIIEVKTQPKRLLKQDGTPTKIGQAWYNLLERRNLPRDTTEVEVIVGYNPGNPNSPEQVKAWLFSLGWVPLEYKTTKSKKTGEEKEVPQVNLPHGAGICPSIKQLYEKDSNLEHLDGLSVLNHRIPMLRGFLETKDKNDCVMAQVNGLSNTLRFKHRHPCVNLPKSEKLYAKAIRGSLVARDGNLLIGADMTSLEDKLKRHFIYPLDPDYVNSMEKKDYDPHIALAIMAGKLNKSDLEFYQWYENLGEGPNGKGSLTEEEIKRYKTVKATRSIFKNGNYASQYGAFPKRLAITCDVSIDEAKEIFDAYWKLNWAIKKVSEQQKIKYIREEMWLLNPISGFYYSLRGKKDIFSTLVQGSASYVFDMWVGFVLRERPQLTGQFHDEIIIEVRQESKDKAFNLLNNSIEKTNRLLKLNSELGIGLQSGDRYSSIH